MIIRDQEQVSETMENYAGGQGKIDFKTVVPPALLKDEAKLFKVLSFDAGAAIGDHAHVDNYEIYYILEGEGIAVDNGQEITVHPGDVVYTADGATHSIRDAGDGNLVMLACVIYENKA
ncbi:MAG: cupin domain-containing protein [Peptococcaceae bacterium]|nr:cupin domain-containing protein [Peptococcaceae bacterium]